MKQSLIRNRYSLYHDDELVLKAKQKLFRLKEDIPFKNSEGNVFMHVKAESMMDVAGDYTLLSEEDGEPIAVLKKNWSFLHHKSKVKDSSNQERLIARISSRGGINILRFIGGAIPYMPKFFKLIPRRYEIENPDGDRIGEIAGRFGIRDIYDLTVEADEASQEAIVAAAVAVDVLEGNSIKSMESNFYI